MPALSLAYNGLEPLHLHQPLMPFKGTRVPVLYRALGYKPDPVFQSSSRRQVLPRGRAGS